MPWGVVTALGSLGLKCRSGYLGKLHDLKHHIDCDRTVVVLIRPTDLIGCRWYDLHYRVLVGYRDIPTAPGGGELYFNCSSSPNPERVGLPGNVSVDCESFLRQWRVWGMLNWYAAIQP